MFRFTIRDMLWLTVVVAIDVGWALNRNHLLDANQQRYEDGLNDAEKWLGAYDGPDAGTVRMHWNLTRYGVPARPADGKFHAGFAH